MLSFIRNSSDVFTNVVSGVLIILLLASINYHGMPTELLVSFYIIGIISYTGSVFVKKNITLRRIVYFFSFIFLFLAPLQQWSSHLIFWQSNGLKIDYTDSDYLRANLLIITFLAIFEISYRISGHFRGGQSRSKELAYRQINGQGMSRELLLVFSLISIFSFSYLALTGNLFSNYIDNQSGGSSLLLQLDNIAKYVPLTVLAISILISKPYLKKNVFRHPVYWTMQFFIVFSIFFPFSGASSRFLIFGAYLFLTALLFNNAKLRAPLFLIILVGFIYVFSAFNVYKSGGTTANLFSVFRPSFSDAFSSVDFDAYQMLMATIQYVKIFGSVHGQNLVSALLCFVPRSIFSFRFESTGAIVVRSFGSYFVNVSTPLVAEMLFAGGLPGLIFLSAGFGLIVRIVDGWGNTSDILRRLLFAIAIGMGFYILRGSLLSAWAYTFSFIIAAVCLSVISRILLRRMRGRSESIGILQMTKNEGFQGRRDRNI